MLPVNAAVQILVRLGAYCPRVKLSDEKTLAVAYAAVKRRVRPMLGRGKYGALLRASFAAKRKAQRHV